MPRRPNPIPPVGLNTKLPADVHAQLTLHLFSDVEGRVPHGAYQEFLVARIKEFFATKPFDLSPYTGLDPTTHTVTGTPIALATLKQLLEAQK